MLSRENTCENIGLKQVVGIHIDHHLGPATGRGPPEVIGQFRHSAAQPAPSFDLPLDHEPPLGIGAGVGPSISQ